MQLEWKDIEPKRMSWDDAKCLEMDGWRLPTRGELVDAYDNEMEGFQSHHYWTSSMYRNIDYRWYFSFHNGCMYGDFKAYSYYVRLCREVK